jgi:hypothetical protein
LHFLFQPWHNAMTKGTAVADPKSVAAAKTSPLMAPHAFEIRGPREKIATSAIGKGIRRLPTSMPTDNG